MTATKQVPGAFLLRRLHSLTGLWLVIFLIEHLLTNSQAALLIGDDGSGFVRAVNLIKSLPYLPAIEIFLLAMPILIHLIWGIVYLRTGQLNAFPSDGSKPSLTEYPRNHAYSWQRITSWILVLTLIGHIVHMRFMEYPTHAKVDGQQYYMVRVDLDEGLYTVAPRLGVTLYDQNMIELQKKDTQGDKALSAGMWSTFVESISGIYQAPSDRTFETEKQQELVTKQRQEQQKEFLEALEAKPLAEGQVIAVAPDFGTAELVVVRETFKMPFMIVLYTIFVLAASFHAFNGLWTFLITWGVNLTERSQWIMRRVSTALMILVAFMGLVAIWGTYWINLNS